MNAQYISTEIIHFVEVTEAVESFCGSKNIFIWTVFLFLCLERSLRLLSICLLCL